MLRSSAVTDGTGRRITTVTFDDAVGSGAASDHSSTTFFDDLGRPTQTQVDLGTSYAGSGEIMVANYTTYDGMGRVAFTADPFPSGTDLTTAYGTSRFYMLDGTPNCFVRATGFQYATASDSGNEVFPTCFSHGYTNQQELFGVMTPDALLAGSPQAGVVRGETRTPFGRPILSETVQGSNELEYTEYAQDHLGRPATLTRHTNIASGAAATSSWTFDSLGWLIKQTGSGSVPQTVTYGI